MQHTSLRFIYLRTWKFYDFRTNSAGITSHAAAKSCNIVKIKHKSVSSYARRREQKSGGAHLRRRGLKSDLSHIPCRDVSAGEKGEERNDGDPSRELP